MVDLSAEVRCCERRRMADGGGSMECGVSGALGPVYTEPGSAEKPCLGTECRLQAGASCSPKRFLNNPTYTCQRPTREVREPIGNARESACRMSGGSLSPAADEAREAEHSGQWPIGPVSEARWEGYQYWSRFGERWGWKSPARDRSRRGYGRRSR